MQLLVPLTIFVAFELCLSAIVDHSDDFYWRDYNGDVPKDALPGGMNREHKPTYIGQAVSQGVLVPGEIIGGVKKMYYFGDYSGRIETENIKIFCTKHPENFEWAKTNVKDVKLISKLRLIPGGFSHSEVVYIGRGIAENMLSVGKVVIPNDSRTPYFKVCVNGNGYSTSEFDVLCYRFRNPDNSSDDSTKIYSNVLLVTVTMFILKFVT
ncbi:hypothetical protein FQA39_LY08212 [Lamprigera yunnana]|nr:hypothetical protein FQA39_LY08212 [Lamprigera yunnana]